MICYIVPWWPSWLSDPIAFSNSESDVVWRVSRLPLWPPSWIMELNDEAVLNLHVTPMPPIKFCLNLTYCFWEKMWFEDFQDGGHLGHWNRRILAILNFHNTPMPPITFKLNQTYPLVADVIWRFSRWLPCWPSWISERNHFRHFKSPWFLDALHHFHSIWLNYSIEADNNWRLSRRPEEVLFENFQDGWHGGHLLERNDFSNS